MLPRPFQQFLQAMRGLLQRGPKACDVRGLRLDARGQIARVRPWLRLIRGGKGTHIHG